MFLFYSDHSGESVPNPDPTTLEAENAKGPIMTVETEDPFEGKRLCRRCFQDALPESDYCAYHKAKIEAKIKRDSERRERDAYRDRRKGR